MRVLLVEDDDTIAETLADGLGRYGFTVTRVATGAAALGATSTDMVLLDLGLPDMDGVDVCRHLRRTSDIPIIMLTARGTETDRVVGLELGADDYLAKPFSLRELVARMRAVARRARPATGAAGSPPAAQEAVRGSAASGWRSCSSPTPAAGTSSCAARRAPESTPWSAWSRSSRRADRPVGPPSGRADIRPAIRQGWPRLPPTAEGAGARAAYCLV